MIATSEAPRHHRWETGRWLWLSVVAVALSDVVHRPLVPIASAGLASGFWSGSGLSSLTHAAVDRASRLGLRTKDVWQGA